MTIGAVPYSGPAELRSGDGSVLIAVLLAFGVVGWEQLLHTGPGGPPLYQVLHWLSDSLMVLPLGLAAVWLGTRLARRQGPLLRRRSDRLARACLIAIVFAVLLVPGGVVHEQIDSLTHAHGAISVHTHGGVPATRDLRDPAVLAAYVLHAFSDGLIGQLVGLPLLLLALAWMARRRPGPSRTQPQRIQREKDDLPAMTSRRQLLQVGAAVGVGSLIRWQIDSKGSSLFQAARALATSGQTTLLGSSVPQFVTPLPTFNGRRVSDMAMQVGMLEFQQKVLPDSFYASLPAPYSAGTYVWGYQVGKTAPSYPASTIVAKRGTMTVVKYVNSLPVTPYLQKLLTIDQTLHWADPLNQMGATQPYAGPQPGVVHLHGAEVPSEYDGVPDAWWTRDGKRGKAYSSMVPTDPNAAVYCYPNRQPATTLWFHDHTLGMTRIGVLAGLAGLYLIRDQFDNGLVGNPLGLPAGDQEIELILQDRQFDTNGQWYFPDSTSNGAGLNGDPTNPLIHPNWIPEFFGDTIVVNGRTWPYLEVEPCRYRFRVVNGANARFFRMSLADSTSGAAGPTIWQIDSDGGLFDRPVKPTDHENSSRLALFVAPGERADIIVDFTGLAGKSLTLTNDAQFPYPSGGRVTAGLDDRVMQFRVTKWLSSRDTTFDPASGGTLRGGANQERPIVRLSNPTTGKLASGVAADAVRQLVLVEVEGNPPAPQPGGPIEVLLNNTRWDGLREGTKEVAGGAGARPDGIGDMVTELPRVGATEVWEVMNLTQDAHPIHLHLIQFQLLNRQQIQTSIDPVSGASIYAYRTTYDSKFAGGKYVGQLADGSWGPTSYAPGNYIPGFGPPQNYTTKNADGAIGGNPAFSPTLVGGTLPPEAGEVGWKDTIKVYPGYVTRIVARWTPQQTAVGAAGPGTNLFPFDPTQGPGYVWHCHILDHEDNEMMRPLKPTN